MSIIKCKMCGGDLTFEAGSTVCECEYCGSKQTLPNADSEKKTNLFNRANRLRRSNEFDKASAVYESIVAEFPEEAEAYWGLCLCAYGIEYVDDPATGSKVPTCHRTMTTSIMEDPNFEQACDNADAIARRVYRDEAKAIDRIQKDILSIAANEAPYDVFICYKELDDAGNRTEDSVIAQEIYDELTTKKFKVFFSRITLEDKLGVQYEPYIYAALSSAKVMLAIGTQFEYYDAVWVKNEWSRFLNMMKTDKTKTLIPCFKGLDAYDIPKEMSRLTAQDMGKLGWKQDLMRGVEKLCGKGNVSAQPTAEMQQTISYGNANAAPLLKRAAIFLEDGDWESANEYCERVLDIDPENAHAYLYKLMAELHVRKQSDLKNYPSPFDESKNYEKALRYSDDSLKKELTEINAYIKERLSLINSLKRILKKQEENLQLITELYNCAKKVMKSARTEADFQKAAKQFQDINSFSDSAAMAVKCIEKANDKKRFDENSAKALKAADIIIAAEEKRKVIEKQTVDMTLAELRQKREKLGLFDIKEKKSTDAKISECEKEAKALQLKIDKLRKEISENGTVGQEEQNITSEAEANLILTQLLDDTAIYKALGNKKIAALKYTETFTQILLKNCKVGNVILYGLYPHEKNQEKEPIEWLVLAKEGKKLLLISKYALDCKQYYSRKADVTWETCTLRTWLNGTFLNEAFNEAEQSIIQTTEVSADKNPYYSTDPGNATKDKIFLLSINDAKKYFASDEARMCVPTAYAIANGARTDDRYKLDGEATCWWWLRSPGDSQIYAAYVYSDGGVSSGGNGVDDGNRGVRPALWINLDS